MPSRQDEPASSSSPPLKAHIGGPSAASWPPPPTASKALSSYNDDQRERKDAIDKQACHHSPTSRPSADVEQLEGMLLHKRERLLTEEADLDLTKSAGLYLASEPRSETTPAKPRVVLNLSRSAPSSACMFGVGLAFALEYMDTSVKTPRRRRALPRRARACGYPAERRHAAPTPADSSPDAEAYRILRTNIEFNRRNANANCITVVSGGAGEGKSTTLTNLAFVCAQGGYNVLLIDADLRRPRLHTLFDTSNAVGLDQLPHHRRAVWKKSWCSRRPIDNLYFLPSGVLPADSCRHPELSAHVRPHRRCEEPLRPRAHRLPAYPRRQRRLCARERSRHDHHRRAASQAAASRCCCA